MNKKKLVEEINEIFSEIETLEGDLQLLNKNLAKIRNRMEYLPSDVKDITDDEKDEEEN